MYELGGVDITQSTCDIKGLCAYAPDISHESKVPVVYEQFERHLHIAITF